MRYTRITETVRVIEVIETDPPWLQEVERQYQLALMYLGGSTPHLALSSLERIRELYVAAGFLTLPAPLSHAYNRAIAARNALCGYSGGYGLSTNRY